MIRTPPVTAVPSRGIYGTIQSLTRPNNVLAYAAGQVFGSAVTGLVQFVVPALPADAVSAVFGQLSLYVVQGRGATDSAVPVNLYLFNGAPATVLADQAALNLSDPDILLLIPLAQAAAQLTPLATANQAGILNMGAGVAGRRVVPSPDPMPTLTANLNQFNFTPGATIGLYMTLSAAYTPVALEKWLFLPTWRYAAHTTI